MSSPVESSTVRPDVATRILKWGLMGMVVLVPLPFGAVTPRGRLGLEAGALALGVVWIVAAALRGTSLPPLAGRAGLVGLLALGLVQTLPLGGAAVGAISPNAMAVRSESTPAGEIRATENRLLRRDAGSLEPTPALSLEPGRTASALRTGAALALLLLVAVSVTRAAGARGLAAALLVSAACQALYGILVLASGHDMIWFTPKVHYLDSATGTFVNKNHFAGFLEAALPCGLALTLSEWRRRDARSSGPLRDRVVQSLGRDGIVTLFLGILLLIGIGGLLLSLSRAGIALGLAALFATIAGAGRRGLRTRLVVAMLLLAVAAVPLVQIGVDRLTDRYWKTTEDFTVSGGRAEIWRDTWAMASDFPLVGAGFGTFASTYPLYRSPEVRFFFAHTHNDLLQAFAEGGVLAILFLGLILAPVVSRMVRAFTGSAGTLAVGFAAAMAATLLHALIDFNFHIPSNAAVAVILAGALLGLPWPRRS